MITAWRTLGVALMLALLAGPAWADSETGLLRGVVFEDGTNLPIGGLTVTIKDVTRKTNRDGAFSLWLGAGNYEVRVSGAGFAETRTPPVTVVAGRSAELVLTIGRRGGPPVRMLVETSKAPVTGPRRIAKDVETGRMAGRLTHIESKRPVANARIFVRGLTLEGRSDKDGHFSIVVPVGKHDITVVHPRYATATATGIPVLKGRLTEVKLELTPAAVELEAYSVVAPRIEGSALEVLEERKESGAVADIIGAEQMAAAGDSSAASALRRVTGVTLVGGKFVFVRGLGERYSSTLLNGSTLPSPEPEKRVVPLDLFPASQLESVLIQKTWSPDLPGEFGGGSVQLRTRSMPDRFVAKLGLSMGIVTGTTFRQGIFSPGGPTDFLGIDGGFRALPDEVRAASERATLAERDQFSSAGYTAAELERFGELLPRTWELEKGTIIPNFGGSLTLGSSWKLGDDIRLGVLGSLTYDNQWSREDEHERILKVSGGDALEVQHEYDFLTVTNTVVLGSILDVGLHVGEDHKLRLTTLVNRITDNQARVYEGYNNDLSGVLNIARHQWVEKMVLAQQAHGTHLFPEVMKLQLDWRYTFSMATRLEPDRRSLRYDYEDNTAEWVLSDRPEGNRRVFSELQDLNHDVSFDLTLPFRQWSGQDAKVKAGSQLVLKDREVDTRRYRFLHRGPLSTSDEVRTLSPNAIFSPQHIGLDGFQLGETTLETDNYLADQQIYAGYVMTDLPLDYGLRLVAGLRLEHSSQNVSTFVPFRVDAEKISANVTRTDVMPMLTVSWDFYRDMVLRLGYSRTVSRPDFRELSPAVRNEVTGGRQVFGNKDLDRAIVNNVDFRWEWYPRKGESLSLGAFFKYFENPIEVVVKPSAQLSVTWENNERAVNWGLELEWRFKLDVLHRALRDLVFSGNATWIQSNITLKPGDSIQTSKERPLQGQSPYVINLQLSYHNVDIGTRATLVYNAVGRRIHEVGALGAPDTYEEALHALDLVVSQEVGQGFTLGFKAKNLLDLPVEYTQGDITVVEYRMGRELSVSLSKSF